MDRIYNIARGISELEVKGENPARLLNAMSENNIEFWEANPADDFCISLKIHSADYPEIKKLRGLNGLDIKVSSSRGGKRIGKHIKRRIALVSALTVFIVLLAVSSLFIWNIDVSGNIKLSDAEIIRTLNDCGINYGTFWPSVSSDMVRSKMLLKLDDVSWITVNLHNSKAEVVVHERVRKPEIYDKNKFCDIVAEKTGIITKMSVLEGERRANVGDSVVEGDVLVSGLMQSETGDDRLIHAKAEVEARTWYSLTAVEPLNQTVKTQAKSSKRRIRFVFGKNVINFCSDSRNKRPACDKIIKYKDMSVNSVFSFPVGILSEHTEQKKTENRMIDVDAETERLKQDLMAELERKIDGGEIIDYSYSVSDDKGLLTVTLHAECRENISIERTKDK